MVVLTAETCRAMNEYWINNKISGIKLVFSLYATIEGLFESGTWAIGCVIRLCTWTLRWTPRVRWHYTFAGLVTHINRILHIIPGSEAMSNKIRHLPVGMWWHTGRNRISSFGEKGRVHLNRRGRQFSRLLATEVCASAVVMLDTPCFEVVRHRVPSRFNWTLLKFL